MPILAHEWFKPRLAALLAEADKAGFARDVAQAAITDLVNGAFAAGPTNPSSDDNWARDIGEPAELAHEMVPTEGLPPETGGAGLSRGRAPGLRRRVRI